MHPFQGWPWTFYQAWLNASADFTKPHHSRSRIHNKESPEDIVNHEEGLLGWLLYYVADGGMSSARSRQRLLKLFDIGIAEYSRLTANGTQHHQLIKTGFAPLQSNLSAIITNSLTCFSQPSYPNQTTPYSACLPWTMARRVPVRTISEPFFRGAL